MKKVIITSILLGIALSLSAQKVFTKEGHIAFTSTSPLETIEADNHKALSIIDLTDGSMEWSVLVKGFQFDKKLMQEHFNENYMESSKYPKAKLVAKLNGYGKLKEGDVSNLELPYTGQLTIHGVTKEVSGVATFSGSMSSLSATSKLVVACADYDIDIPKVVRDNIAKEITIDVSADYQVLDK